MKRLLVIWAIVMLFLFTGAGSVYASGDAKTPSGIEYRQLNEEIAKYIEERKEGTASVSVAVYQYGKTLSTTRYGYADVENRVPVDADTVYEWGSVSKMLIWVSAMQLHEKGQLDLQADIRTYLPEGFLTKLKYDEPITFIDLMNHKTGFQETVYAIEFSDPAKLTSLEEALAGSEPSQIEAPDTFTAYSNWGSALAALIVERISGMDYADYVRNNILQPLEMNQTAVKADLSDNPFVNKKREAIKTYSAYSDRFESFGVNRTYINLYPAGSAAGTLDDFAKFAKAFTPEIGRKSPLFEKEETLRTMLSPTSFYTGTEIARNTHGLWTMEFGVPIVGHGGNTIGFSSMLMIDPKSGTGIVVMTNEQAETAYNYGLLSLLYGNQKGSGEWKTEPKINGIYQGKRTVDTGFLRVIQYIGGILPISKTDQPDEYRIMNHIEVSRIAETIFRTDDGNGLEYVMNLTETKEGRPILESYTADYEKVDPIEFAAAWALLIGTLVSGLFSAIRIPMLVVRLIRTKDKNVRAPIQNHIATLALVVLLFTIWLFKTEYIFSEMLVLCAIIAILALILLVRAILRMKTIQNTENRNERLLQIAATVLQLMPVVSVVFFQSYNPFG